jgi:hypothetical protein
MTGKTRGDADLGMPWMGIDDEVLIRCHGVHAGDGARNLSV